MYVLVILPVLLINTGHTASFDCSQAKTAVEKMICADEELSILDEELSILFEKAIALKKNSMNIKIEQRYWLEKRDICKEKDCIKDFYRNRISALQIYLTLPSNCSHLNEHSETSVQGNYTPMKIKNKSMVLKSNDNLYACIKELALSRRLLAFGVEYTGDIVGQLVYALDINNDNTLDSLVVSCGYSTDAECEFVLNVTHGETRIFYDLTGFRLIQIGGSYYLVYGVIYTINDSLINDKFRIVHLTEEQTLQICDK